MERPSVEVRVGGQTFRLVASAGADEVERLATIVDGKLREMHATTAFHPQSMLLVAITLAHELEQHVTVFAVEAIERLVEQQQLGVRHERPRENAALLLPARELAKPAPGEPCEADPLERLCDSATPCAAERPKRPE